MSEGSTRAISTPKESHQARRPRPTPALRLDIDNWRWSGVPFFIRTGKHLPITQTEVRMVFKRPPKLGFGFSGDRRPDPNQLIIRMDPRIGVRWLVDARRADAPGPETIFLDMEFSDEGGEGATPYEILLHAALVGQTVRFTRQDGVEEAWRIMQPLLEGAQSVQSYAQGTWGPTLQSTWSLVSDAGTSRGLRHE